MTGETFTCMIGDCGQRFPSKAAKDKHRKEVHNAKPKGMRGRLGKLGQRAAQRRGRDMSPEVAMDFCDALDLPDGAYWAMIEELSGAEPGDFA